MSGWTEVNILPATAKDAERMLMTVAAPLVDAMRGDWDRWHFFWEPELRLRFRWRESSDAAACREAVAAHLSSALDAGQISSWEDTPYDGEADGYGPGLWEAVVADWMSGSELALAIIRAGKDKPGPRGFYWERRSHLFANELGLPEAATLLWEADGRMDMWGDMASPKVADVREAIGRYFATSQMTDWEWRIREMALARAISRQDGSAPTPRSGPVRLKRRRSRAR